MTQVHQAGSDFVLQQVAHVLFIYISSLTSQVIALWRQSQGLLPVLPVINSWFKEAFAIQIMTGMIFLG